MKIKGKKVTNDNVELLVIPRKEQDIVLQFRPVLNFDRFDQLVKAPDPPSILFPGGVKGVDVKDKDYLESLNEYAKLKSAYIFLSSIKETPELEWETVDYEDPTTWNNYIDELKASEFTDNEIAMMLEALKTANSLNNVKLDEARDRFLALQAQAQ